MFGGRSASAAGSPSTPGSTTTSAAASTPCTGSADPTVRTSTRRRVSSPAERNEPRRCAHRLRPAVPGAATRAGADAGGGGGRGCPGGNRRRRRAASRRPEQRPTGAHDPVHRHDLRAGVRRTALHLRADARGQPLRRAGHTDLRPPDARQSRHSHPRDIRVRCIGRQVAAAAFAGRSDLEHRQRRKPNAQFTNMADRQCASTAVARMSSRATSRRAAPGSGH